MSVTNQPIMLSVIMLSVIILSVIMLSVIMLCRGAVFSTIIFLATDKWD